MSNLNEIPREFQILSTQPELRIRCSSRIRGWGKIFFLIFFLPFCFLFIRHALLLVDGLYEILHLRLWQAIQLFTYKTGNLWAIPTFFFAFFGLGFVVFYLLWLILGVTEVYARSDYLTIRYELLGLSRKVSLLTNDIEYFNQFLNENSEGHTWDLEVVTNRKYSKEDRTFASWVPVKMISEDMLVRLNYKTIHLYADTDSNLSGWLGNVLANFYRIRFQSIAQPNNRAAPER
jgi:hypothetical protein